MENRAVVVSLIAVLFMVGGYLWTRQEYGPAISDLEKLTDLRFPSEAKKQAFIRDGNERDTAFAMELWLDSAKQATDFCRSNALLVGPLADPPTQLIELLPRDWYGAVECHKKVLEPGVSWVILVSGQRVVLFYRTS